MGRFPSGLTNGYQSWLAQDNGFISKEPPSFSSPQLRRTKGIRSRDLWGVGGTQIEEAAKWNKRNMGSRLKKT